MVAKVVEWLVKWEQLVCLGVASFVLVVCLRVIPSAFHTYDGIVNTAADSQARGYASLALWSGIGLIAVAIICVIAIIYLVKEVKK